MTVTFQTHAYQRVSGIVDQSALFDKVRTWPVVATVTGLTEIAFNTVCAIVELPVVVGLQLGRLIPSSKPAGINARRLANDSLHLLHKHIQNIFYAIITAVPIAGNYYAWKVHSLQKEVTRLQTDARPTAEVAKSQAGLQAAEKVVEDLKATILKSGTEHTQEIFTLNEQIEKLQQQITQKDEGLQKKDAALKQKDAELLRATSTKSAAHQAANVVEERKSTQLEEQNTKLLEQIQHAEQVKSALEEKVANLVALGNKGAEELSQVKKALEEKTTELAQQVAEKLSLDAKVAELTKKTEVLATAEMEKIKKSAGRSLLQRLTKSKSHKNDKEQAPTEEKVQGNTKENKSEEEKPTVKEKKKESKKHHHKTSTQGSEKGLPPETPSHEAPQPPKEEAPKPPETTTTTAAT